MADKEHLAKIKLGMEAWNQWREFNLEIVPDLTWADLRNINISGYNLRNVNFKEANLTSSILQGADLTNAELNGVYFVKSDLRDAILIDADLTGALLKEADLRNANLNRAILKYARMVDAKVEDIILTNCHVYGIAAWNLQGTPKEQRNLIINRRMAAGTPSEPTITVDDLEVAQFINMLLNHRKVRDVIRTIGERAVLLLGRFTEDRKRILEAVAGKLKELKYMPIIFDFEKIPGRDYTETILTLAGMSKFIIADITQPKSVPQESQAIVPNFKLPFVRLIQKGEDPWSMNVDLDSFDWVIKPVVDYLNEKHLIDNLPAVVAVAERKHKELAQKKAIEIVETLSIDKLAELHNG